MAKRKVKYFEINRSIKFGISKHIPIMEGGYIVIGRSINLTYKKLKQLWNEGKCHYTVTFATINQNNLDNLSNVKLFDELYTVHGISNIESTPDGNCFIEPTMYKVIADLDEAIAYTNSMKGLLMQINQH